jgi:hypothetical protein
VAAPHPFYRGYWELSNEEGVFFRHWSCEDENGERRKYFYRLTDTEAEILEEVTRFNHRINYFRYSRGEWEPTIPYTPYNDNYTTVHPGDPRFLALAHPIRLFMDPTYPDDIDNLYELPLRHPEFEDPHLWTWEF